MEPVFCEGTMIYFQQSASKYAFRWKLCVTANRRMCLGRGLSRILILGGVTLGITRMQ